MPSISLNNLSVVSPLPLFSQLTLTIGAGDRVGLIAGNGGGKTTLLRCIAGRAEPTGGDIVRSRGLRIGYVEQDVPPHLDTLTLRAAVGDALPAELQETESWRVDIALDAFAAPDDLRDRAVGALSGGWKRLMLIARVWVTEPDALLLDEPTNHLDLGKIIRLERWLTAETSGMPVIIASHDRAFLDRTTNRTLFLRPGTSREYALPFSAARAALAEADAAHARQQERDLKAAAQLRRQAAKLTNIGINSGSDLLTVKSRQLRDRAGRIEASVQELHRERSGDIRLSNSGTHARVLIAAEALKVATPDGTPLFSIPKLHLFQGDRLVLLGRNGAGKSQFVRLMHSAIRTPDSVPGLRVATSLRLGYADQELSHLPARETPFGLIAAFGQGDQRTKALLAAAGFPLERHDRPIGTLSFGQKSRLGLLALRLAEPNFYLLDEPTNHLDIAGQEQLESEILTHGASCVLVSHDRSFVRTLGTRFFEIRRRSLVEVDSPEPFFAAQEEEPD